MVEQRRVSDRWKGSEAHNRALLAALPDLMFQLTRDGTFVNYHAPRKELLIAKPSEFLGRKIEEILPPDLASQARRNLERALNTRRIQIFEYELELPNGNVTHNEARIVSCGEDEVLIIVRDVSDRKAAERALKQSEESLAEAQRIAQLGNWDWDIADNILRWSDEIYRIFGLAPQEFGATYEAFLGTVHPGDRETVKSAVNKALYENQPYSLEHRIVRPDGSERIVHERGEVFLNDKGLAVRMVGTVQDITEHATARDALRQAEHRNRELLDHMKSGVAVYQAVDDGGDFVFVDFNRGAEVIEGVRKEDLIGRRVTEVFPGVGKLGLFEVFQRVWRTGTPEHLPVSLYSDEMITGWRDNYVYKLPTGEVVALYDDVTEEKQAEEALRSSERWMSTILNSVEEAVIATDSERRVKFMNPTAQKLTGWTLEQAQGRDLDDVYIILSERTQERVDSPATRLLRHGKGIRGPGRILLVSMTGTRRPISQSGATLLDAEGNAEGVVLVFRDVSEQQRTDADLRQRQKLEAIGTLASGVAHEINNPINVILNCGELILGACGKEGPMGQNAATIIKESGRIAAIVKKLLAFSRQESESHADVPMVEIVNDVLTLIDRVLAKEQISLSVDFPGNLPDVKCRRQQLQQVLLNLLTNARDALNERYPGYDPDKRLAITGRLIKQDGRQWVRTSVEDHGIGIDPAFQDRIFDPFFTTKPRHSGTGLGLSVSFGIVKDHGGTLKAECGESGYTCFHLDLPVGGEEPPD